MSLSTPPIQTIMESRRTERDHTCVYAKPFSLSCSNCACVAVEQESVGAMAKSGRVWPPSRFFAVLSLLICCLCLAAPAESSGFGVRAQGLGFGMRSSIRGKYATD